MMKVAIVALFIALASASSFESWAAKHGKVYTAAEKARRERTFVANAKLLPSLAAEHPLATFGLTQFADMTFEEFSQTYLGTRPVTNSPRLAPLNVKADVPETWDWRESGRVNPVQNQGSCGSCWAFSTTVYLEGWHAKTNPLLKLSEQQLVDCDHECQNPEDPTSCDNGCNGGWMVTGMRYALKSGSMANKDYPYKGRETTCAYAESKVEARYNGTAVVLAAGDEEGLLQRAYSDGPIAVAVNANMAWQLYMGGVVTGTCHNAEENLNHGVAVVAWGHDDQKNVDYWTIRNSWGASWGESGHIRLVRGINQCGLANDATVLE